MARIYSSKEAAEHLGISHVRVRALIAAGRIRAFKVGTSWAIYGSDLDRFAAKPREVGRPAKKRRK